MKLKKYFKLTLSGVLTAAMLLTAVPGSFELKVYAENENEEIYNYTVYYYDSDQASGENGEMKETDASLYIWQDGGSKSGFHDFTSVETLEDGRTWAKAEVSLKFADIGLITKIQGKQWNGWQDNDRFYKNTDKNKNTTLYVVNDDLTIYTELPEIPDIKKRNLVVDYTRTDGETSKYFFYTWNNGFGTNFYPFEEKDGRFIATVPLKESIENVTYCIVSGTQDANGVVAAYWDTKDGSDHNCAVPSGQSFVKINMEEGKGITYVYPYSSGYEIDTLNKKVHFYYRNEKALLDGLTGEAYSVQVEIDGNAYDMVFDKEEQRYEYDMEGLEPNSYKYRYIVKETDKSEAEYVLDEYNTEVVTENDTDYSVCKYEQFELEVKAEMFNASMDYNDNNVLSFDFVGKNGADISGFELSRAVADLSELGGLENAEIETALKELTVSVKEGTQAGKKIIPVTIYDQYSNQYNTQAEVEVKDRDKGSDFDWDEAVIYFAVTDRFFDGNEANNNPGYDVSEKGGSSYHGGDFAGLTAKLDYLSELGVNTIWITPIVENKMDNGFDTDVKGVSSWGYHGYWASDFTKLDSHLGTEEEFAKLLDEAHARGIKIMVDVVLNHTGYNNEEYFNNILKDENGNSIPVIRTAENMVNGDDQKSSLSGLPDFLTENEEVRNLVVEWQSQWISKYDIDYYRVDTVKHVDDTTWSAFKNALTKINPKFKMIGEWAGGGYSTDTGMLREGRMDSLLDFDFNNEATDFVKGKIEKTEEFMVARNNAIDNTATLGAFLGSHDEDGFVQALKSSGFHSKRSPMVAKVAASLQITSKGQPVIYYGEEVGQTGKNDYPYQTNRYDFDWSLVNDENDVLKHYKKMLAIRNQYSEVFAKGTRTTIEASDEMGYDIFAKSHEDITIYTALNIKDEPASYTFTGLKANAEFVNLYNDEALKTDENGNVTITIPGAPEGGTAVIIEKQTQEEAGKETKKASEIKYGYYPLVNEMGENLKLLIEKGLSVKNP